MTYFDPFTAQLNADLTAKAVPPMTDTLPTYDPEIHTLIDGVVTEIDATGGQRFTNGKTLVDTVKHVQSIEHIESLTGYGRAKADAYESLNNRITKAQSNFRNLLTELWDSGLDQTQLAEVFAEHDLPVPKRKFRFTAEVTISVFGIVGYGKDEEEAWEDATNEGRISAAFSDGNYDTYNMSDPYSYEEFEEDELDAEDPDFSSVNLFELT